MSAMHALLQPDEKRTLRKMEYLGAECNSFLIAFLPHNLFDAVANWWQGYVTQPDKWLAVIYCLQVVK